MNMAMCIKMFHGCSPLCCQLARARDRSHIKNGCGVWTEWQGQSHITY